MKAKLLLDHRVASAYVISFPFFIELSEKFRTKFFNNRWDEAKEKKYLASMDMKAGAIVSA